MDGRSQIGISGVEVVYADYSLHLVLQTNGSLKGLVAVPKFRMLRSGL